MAFWPGAGLGGGFDGGFGFGGGFGGFEDERPGEAHPKLWKQGEDFLQNTFHFPSFRNLPHENEVEYGYWKRNFMGMFNPACTWFFMAEITNDEVAQIPFLRNRVEVRDRAGGACPIYFYPEGGYFDFKTLKTGRTILVTNGQKHNFMDGSIGLRIEQLDAVSVVPCSMSDLMLLSNDYHEKKDTKCWCCGSDEDTTAATPVSSASGADAELKRCAACLVARYCSKECQKKDWKEGHKRGCKAVPIFKKLISIDYAKHDESAYSLSTPFSLF